jgi:hypothetical protein
VSILTSSRDRYRAQLVGSDELSYTVDSQEKLKAMDFGFVISAGYALTDFTKGTGMEFYIRYYQGFLDVSKEKGFNYLNGVIQLSVSFPFILPAEAE